jgi:hypothetical protein
MEHAMPYSTEFASDGLGLIHVGEGIVTGAEMLAGSLVVQQLGERMRQLRYGLTDLSEIEEFRVTPADLRALAQEQISVARDVPEAAVAVVAASDFTFGMARMWEALAEETRWITHVFRELSLAEDWLREMVPGATPERPYQSIEELLRKPS